MPGLTLQIDRRAGPVGRIQRSSGTYSRRLFREINQVITHLIQHGRWGPLEDLRDGRIRPVDLPQMWSAPYVKTEHLRECVIYIIRAVPSGNIKIGITDDVARRLRGLRAASYEELEVVSTFPGTGRAEKQIHAQLKASCIRGEWFRPTEEVLAWVDSPKPTELSLTEYPANWRRKPRWLARLDAALAAKTRGVA